MKVHYSKISIEVFGSLKPITAYITKLVFGVFIQKIRNEDRKLLLWILQQSINVFL